MRRKILLVILISFLLISNINASDQEGACWQSAESFIYQCVEATGDIANCSQAGSMYYYWCINQ